MSDSLDGLKALLSLAKQAPPEKADEEFYEVMVKAKDAFGEMGYQMAQFYYEYGHFMLERIEKNMDIFNSGAVPAEVEEGDEAEELENIPQDYEDSQNEQGQEQGGQQQQNGNTDPVIEEQAIQQENKAQNQPEEEDIDDKQICYCNLQFAIRIYEGELEKIRAGSSSQANIEDVLNGLRRSRTRLGDIYMLDEEYQKCIAQYKKVVEQEKDRDGFDTNRLIAQIHYLIGNCLMYQNAAGCQILALAEYVKAVSILVNHLAIKQEYDIVDFELPTSQHYKVDRFAYLSKPQDSQTVKEIKEVITCLLDRIEDTHDQIGQRESYEAEKQKVEEERKMSEFKPVPEEAKVINLGSFGNRKRKPESTPQTSPPSKQQTPQEASKVSALNKPEPPK